MTSEVKDSLDDYTNMATKVEDILDDNSSVTREKDISKHFTGYINLFFVA